MSDDLHGYRDELAAAHARIAELEASLADALGAKPPSPQAELAHLEEERVWIQGRSTQDGTRTKILLFGAALLAAALTYASMTFTPAIACLIALGGGAVLLEKGRRDRQLAADQRLEAVVRRIADVSREAQVQSALEHPGRFLPDATQELPIDDPRAIDSAPDRSRES